MYVLVQSGDSLCVKNDITHYVIFIMWHILGTLHESVRSENSVIHVKIYKYYLLK